MCVSGQDLTEGPNHRQSMSSHLTCRNTLNANIASSVATNTPMPKKRIFITIGTRLAYERFLRERRLFFTSEYQKRAVIKLSKIQICSKRSPRDSTPARRKYVNSC